MSASTTKPPRRRVPGFTHLSDVIDQLLTDFELGVELEIVKRGGFHGPVRQKQRLLSRTLDRLTRGRDDDLHPGCLPGEPQHETDEGRT